MIARKLEVLQELNLTFVSNLRMGDSFKVKAANQPKTDIVAFDGYNDIYITFIYNGVRNGIFWQQVRENKVEILS